MENFWQSRTANIIKKRLRTKLWPRTSFQLPRFQAHRGFHLNGKDENTLAAFHAAAERGAQMVELDVRLSQEGIPVVFHDENLGRWNDEATLVAHCSAQQLYERTGAPTLEQVLLDSGRPPFLNIELKSKNADDSLERRVWNLLKKTNSIHRVLISSFNPLSIWKFSQMTSEIPLALLVGKNTDFWLRDMWVAPFLDFHILHLQDEMVTAEWISHWKDFGLPVAVWTVNEKERIRELFHMGVASVISDQYVSEGDFRI